MRLRSCRRAFCHLSDILLNLMTILRDLVRQSIRRAVDGSAETIVYSVSDVEFINQVLLGVISASMLQFGGVCCFVKVRGGVVGFRT